MFVVWIVIAGLAQRPDAPAQSAEDAAQEARHLKNIRQVTFGFARAGEGYFSPDGHSIVFQAVPPTPTSIFHSPQPNEDGYQIYMAALENDATPRLISTGKGRCTCAFFRPDGKAVLFSSNHLDPDVDRLVAPRGPAYSRTERYRWDFPEYTDIFVRDLAHPDAPLLQLTDTPGYDAEASYSPDGRTVAFTSFRHGDANIYTMKADGTNVRQITSSPGYDGGPFISPDGKRLIYRSDRKSNDLLQLFVNSVEGGAERQLTDNEDVNWGPYWFTDSRHIVYATSKHGHTNYEIYWMDVDSGQQERITFHDGFDGLPVFSRDGKRLMWTSSGRTADKKSQLFIADFVIDTDQAAAARP
jgi:Tol biopolymer transport system component